MNRKVKSSVHGLGIINEVENEDESEGMTSRSSTNWTRQQRSYHQHNSFDSSEASSSDDDDDGSSSDEDDSSDDSHHYHDTEEARLSPRHESLLSHLGVTRRLGWARAFPNVAPTLITNEARRNVAAHLSDDDNDEMERGHRKKRRRPRHSWLVSWQALLECGIVVVDYHARVMEMLLPKVGGALTSLHQSSSPRVHGRQGRLRRELAWKQPLQQRPLKSQVGSSTTSVHILVCCNCFATFSLATGLLLWFCLALMSYGGIDWRHRHYRDHAITIAEARKSASWWSFLGWTHTHHHHHHHDNDPAKDDCVRPDWQSFHFPTCLDIHAIDLPKVRQQQQDQVLGPVHSAPLGLLGNGFWRTVWAVHPRGEPLFHAASETAALKLMRAHHDWDARNFERHRRDALVMERLSSSPHIVDIYGHCGMTVLTEFIERTLYDVIYPQGKRTFRRPTAVNQTTNPLFNDDDTITSASTLLAWRNNNPAAHLHNESLAPTATRLTPEGRWHLAWEMAQGLAELHGIPGGPAVHTDITSKQFLVTGQGRVKLNDFNRIRLVAHNQSAANGTKCLFRIPDAPGKARAPEEYNFDELDEKLDVYSAANVLFEILTGTNPHDQLTTLEAQQYVREGYVPLIDVRQQSPWDARLAELTERAYAFRRQDRISAKQLVRELEVLRLKQSDDLSNSTVIQKPGDSLK
jgi:serine/threonine protein kinase